MLLVAFRCLSLVPAAFPLLLAAFRLKECKSRCLVPSAVRPASRAVNPCKSMQIDAKSLLINCKSFLVASRCFSLLPLRSRCLPLCLRRLEEYRLGTCLYRHAYLAASLACYSIVNRFLLLLVALRCFPLLQSSIRLLIRLLI